MFYAVIFVGALRFGGLPLFIGELYSAVAAEGFNTSVVGSFCLLGKEATGNPFVMVSVVCHAITAFSVVFAIYLYTGTFMFIFAHNFSSLN